MAKDYSSVELPHETTTVDGIKAVILAVEDGYCLGYYYFRKGPDGCALDPHAVRWSITGRFYASTNTRSNMDLIPAPGALEDELHSIRGERDVLAKRLADNPDAPAEWREGDEEKIKKIDERIEKLTQLGGKDADS